MAAAAINHIHLDENGVAWIDDTRVKVIEIALDKLAYGESAEQLHEQYPHLSLGQVHAALAYYYDNRPELDAQIERDDREIVRLRQQAGESPVARRLRDSGLLR